MANTTLTVDQVLKEAQYLFKNESSFLQSMTRTYDDSYSSYGAEAGDTIRLKQPQRYTYRTGKTVDVQDNVENAVNMARTSQGGVDLKFSSKEKTLDINRFSELYLRPAIQTVVSNVEADIASAAALGVSQAVALPGSGTIDNLDLLNAGVILDNASCPRGNMARTAVFTPQGQADLVSSSSTLFNPSKTVSGQYGSGEMGNAYGFDVKMCQNLSSITRGADDGAYLMAAVGVEGASEIDVDTGTGALVAGDIFTVAGVYDVNRVTGESTGILKQFRVTAASAGGTVTLAIKPALVTVGAYKEITALPANNAAVTFLGTASTAYPQNLAFSKGAFAFGTVDLEIPTGANVASKGWTGRSVSDGISLRIVEFYDGMNDDTYTRIDVLYGFAVVIPEFACRIYGV